MSEGALDFDEVARPILGASGVGAPSLRIQFVDCSPYRSQRNLAYKVAFAVSRSAVPMDGKKMAV